MISLLHRRRSTLSLILAGVLFSLLILLGSMVIVHGRQVLEGQLRDRLRDIAAASAEQFDGSVLAGVKDERSRGKAPFLFLVDRLHTILQNIPVINSAYIMRRTEDPMKLAFVADATMLESPAQLDVNHNGIVELHEEAPKIGQLYDATNVPAMRLEAFEGATTDEDITSDQWGSTISGYAPIRDVDTGKIVGILGVDMDAKLFLSQSHDLFLEYTLFFVLIGALCVASAMILIYRESTMQMVEEARRGMLLIATHQLGEPLTIIRNSAEMLVDSIESPDLKAAVSEHIDMLAEGIKRMDTVFVHLKEASLVEKKEMKVTMGPVDVRDVLQDVSVALRERQEKRKQHISVQVEGDIIAYSDRYLLRRALSELIDNSLSFSREGSEVHVLAYRDDGHVVIKVQDHGCGIPKKDLHRIFEKFGRASNAATMKPGGYGLGLFVIKGILGRLEGEIHVQSEEGDGSVFTIVLPAHYAESKGAFGKVRRFLHIIAGRLVH